MNRINKSSLLALVFFLFAFLTVLALPAQKLFSLKGQVVDAATDLPIAGVVIQIPGTKFKDISNEDGFYAIENLPPGTNVVSITVSNYIAQSVTMVIRGNKTFNAALESVFTHDLPNDNSEINNNKKGNDDQISLTREETKKEKKQKEPKAPKIKKEKKPKIKKKSKKELIAEEFARKSVYEKKIENVVAFENLYFSEFKTHKNKTQAIGFFSVENKEIYLFTADFIWENNVCQMKNIDINLKGVQ